jgi:AcrR family transcriptional regulator
MARVKDPAIIDRLFEAALRHVLETGYAGLKMAEVAREAGGATGTIYTYFWGKADLINQLYRHFK